MITDDIIIKLISPINNECVSLAKDAHREFFKDKPLRVAYGKTKDTKCAYSWFVDGVDNTCPEPVVFKWEINIEETGLYILTVSENADLSNPIVKTTSETSLECYNLCIGKTYYWCVQKEGKRSEIGVFMTADETPRCIKLEGTENVRDLGGYKVDGGRTRQGLIYRGAEIDNNRYLSKNGIEEFLRLGIRTEIDLRGEAGNIKDYHWAMEPFGVKGYYTPIAQYGDMSDGMQINSFGKIFKLLADKNSYPIYFHCIAGADRTGMLAIMLGGLLGIPYETLLEDYEFTCMRSIHQIRSRNDSGFLRFITQLLDLEGNTFQEKVIFYLKQYIGVTDEQLDSIRNILIEPTIIK